MPAFLFTPLFKWGASIVGVLILLGGVWFGIQNAIKKHDDGIRTAVQTEVKMDALKEQANSAEQDRKFAQEVFDAQAKDTEALGVTKQNSAARIKQARNTITGKIADGTLEDRTASPLILDGIAQIDMMYAERKEDRK